MARRWRKFQRSRWASLWKTARAVAGVAVVAVLAGEVEGSWALRWRVEYFFWLVKMQSRWPLVPRISFAPMKAAETQSGQRAAKV